MVKPSKDEAKHYDAIALLRADHQEVRDLFGRYETTPNKRTKWEIAEKIFGALERHTRLEEKIFYPTFAAETDRAGADLVAESLKEHDAARVLIAELRALKSEDALFQEKFYELRAHVEHHAQDEEGRMLPAAQRELGEQLQAMVHELRKLKPALLAS